MGLGVSILLIAAGAILAWAVNASVSGVDIQTVGWILLVVGAGATVVALVIPWLPSPASRQAGRIDFVFWFVTAISIMIFALVAAVMFF